MKQSWEATMPKANPAASSSRFRSAETYPLALHQIGVIE